MRKFCYILALVTLCLAACDDNNDNEVLINESLNNGPLKSVMTYIRADANEHAATRSSVDDNTAAFTWNTDDKIAVYTTDGYKISNGLANTYDGTNAATFAFSDMVDDHRADFAIFPASLVWDGTNIRANSATNHSAANLTLTLPASYTLAEVQDEISPTPMIATNAPGGSLSFKSLCALLRITVQHIPNATRRLEFDFNGKKVQGEFTLTGVTPGTTGITTSATTGTDDIITVTTPSIPDIKTLTINLPVPAGVASTGEYTNVTISAYDAATDGNRILYESYPIKKTANWVPGRKASRKMIAKLPHLFTVSNDKQVVFSPGNLQATYNGTAWTWAFAENQWDYVGNASANTKINGNGTVSENGTVDLFGWVGKSSSFTGVAQYGISNSTTNDNYGLYRDEALKSDWGNTIGAGWRTLTLNEWDYLLYTRTTTSGARFAKVTVNSKNGVILLPDDWSTSYHSLESTNTSGVSYTTNIINATDWANDFEAHGAVFLPASGYRTGVTINNPDTSGRYVSSSSSSSDSRYVMFLSFDDKNMNTTSTNYRYHGRAVRLVHNAN